MGGDEAPDPTSAAQKMQQQEEMNKASLKRSVQASQINQVGPMGSQTWSGDIGGQRTMTTAFSPEQKALYDQTVGSQLAMGKAGKDLFDFGNYSTMPDFSAAEGGVVNQRMQHMYNYMNPFNVQKEQELDNTLRNQGIYPGDPAYDKQMLALRDQQQQSSQNFLAQIQPQAHAQAVQDWQLPAQMAQGFINAGKPGELNFGPSQQFSSNTTDALKANQDTDQLKMDAWKAQQSQNSGMMSGIFGLAGTALGGPLGGMLGSAAGSMLSGALGPQSGTSPGGSFIPAFG